MAGAALPGSRDDDASDRRRLRVAGIDGYGRGAWVAVVVEGGRFSHALAGRSLAVLLPSLGDVAVIGIDISRLASPMAPPHARLICFPDAG